MEWIWVVLLTALFIFCIGAAYALGLRKGYVNGATRIVHIWKETLNETGEYENENKPNKNFL